MLLRGSKTGKKLDKNRSVFDISKEITAGVLIIEFSSDISMDRSYGGLE